MNVRWQGRGKRPPSVCSASPRWQQLGANLPHLAILPEAASWSSVVHAEDRAANEIEMASRCLKSSKGGGDTEQIWNGDHSCEDVQVPPRACHRESENDVSGMFPYRDLWLLAQIYKDNDTKPHSEDQLCVINLTSGYF